MGNESADYRTSAENSLTEAEGASNDDSGHGSPMEANDLLDEEDLALAGKVAGRTRFIATVPSTGLLIASVVLAIGTIVNLVISSFEFVIGEIELHEVIIEYVEYADAFLLAVALYILSIGLLRLFVSENIPLPTWLEFRDFNDLKERLIGVIIVMLGVFFLGYVLEGPQGVDTLWVGLGCAAVIVGLSVFMWTAFGSEE